MDSVEQAEAYAETDFSGPHDEFVRKFRDLFPDFSSGKVLDLGCGTADVIIRFAKVFQKTDITGIDGASEMLDFGIRDIVKNGLEEQINLHKCLLSDKLLLKSKYDAVISNSLLHHLKDPLVIWKTVMQCAKPGAPVFIMDLYRPTSSDKADEIVRMYAADAPPLLQKDFYNSLLAAYTKEEIIEQLNTLSYNSLTVEIISDRHVLVWGKNNE